MDEQITQQPAPSRKGFDWVKVTTTVIFVLLTAVIFLIIGYYTGQNYKGSSNMDESIQTVRPTKSPVTSRTATAGNKLYSNDKYGFSFEYPSDWINFKPEEGGKVIGEYKVLFSIGFKDPKQEELIRKVDCINNEKTEWANPNPTEDECKPLLLGLSSEQKEELYTKEGNALPRNIFVYVYKGNGAKKDISDWLIGKYRLPETELQDYKPGKKITMAGQDGYVSNLSCCAGYNLNYVIQNKSYVFELGTYDQKSDDSKQSDNTLLEKIAKSFIIEDK